MIYTAFFLRITLRFTRVRRPTGDTSTIGRLSLRLIISLMVANFPAAVLLPTMIMISATHAMIFLSGLIVGRLRHPSSWTSFEPTEYVEEYAVEGESFVAGAYN